MADLKIYNANILQTPYQSVDTPLKEAPPLASGDRPDLKAMAVFGKELGEAARDINYVYGIQVEKRDKVKAESIFRDYKAQSDADSLEWTAKNQGIEGLKAGKIKEFTTAYNLKVQEALEKYKDQFETADAYNAFKAALEIDKYQKIQHADDHIQAQTIHVANQNMSATVADIINQAQAGQDLNQLKELATTTFIEHQKITGVPDSQLKYIIGQIDEAGKKATKDIAIQSILYEMQKKGLSDGQQIKLVMDKEFLAKNGIEIQNTLLQNIAYRQQMKENQYNIGATQIMGKAALKIQQGIPLTDEDLSGLKDGHKAEILNKQHIELRQRLAGEKAGGGSDYMFALINDITSSGNIRSAPELFADPKLSLQEAQKVLSIQKSIQSDPAIKLGLTTINNAIKGKTIKPEDRDDLIKQYMMLAVKPGAKPSEIADQLVKPLKKSWISGALDDVVNYYTKSPGEYWQNKLQPAAPVNKIPISPEDQKAIDILKANKKAITPESIKFVKDRLK